MEMSAWDNPLVPTAKKVWATMDEDEQRTYISQFEDWGGYYDAESFQAPLFPKRKLRRSLRNACERCGDEGYRKSGISNTQCERCNRWVHNCCLLPSHDQHGEDVVSCQDCAENFASARLAPCSNRRCRGCGYDAPLSATAFYFGTRSPILGTGTNGGQNDP